MADSDFYRKVKFLNGRPWYAKDTNDLQDYLWDKIHNAIYNLHGNVRISGDGCELVGNNLVINGQYYVGGYLTKEYSSESIALSSGTRYVYFRISWIDLNFMADNGLAIPYDSNLIETSERQQVVIELLEGFTLPSDTSTYQYVELAKVNTDYGIYRQIRANTTPNTFNIIAHRATESTGYASINGIEGGGIVLPKKMKLKSISVYCDGNQEKYEWSSDYIPDFSASKIYQEGDYLQIHCFYITDHWSQIRIYQNGAQEWPVSIFDTDDVTGTISITIELEEMIT